MNHRVKVGLIGAGRIGQLHADNMATRLPMAELIGVADIDLVAARQVAERSDGATVTSDYRELLAMPEIEAVVICSSTDTHAQITQEAAGAGKHIFCEKPIDLDLERIDKTLRAVDRAGVKFQVGFNRRFDPNFRRVRQMVADGSIGNPEVLRITSRDPGPPPLDYIRVSGGIFLDMTIHDFDMARFLIDSEVESLYAVGQVRVDPAIGEAGDIDTAVITLEFENGVIGTIDNSRRAVYGYDQRVEVFGSAGVVMVGNETPDRHVHLNAQGSHGPLPLHFFLERYTESYLAELQAFLQAVVEDGDVPVGGQDGRIPVVMGLAAGRSLRERRPVRLDEVG
jgi:myo-inositol 2-dehydrogenase/D-chiro-inositol 1-dehydrogenase